MLQHLLETNLQQQVVTKDLAQSLKVATKELLCFHQLTATSVPLPNPCREAQYLLPRLKPEGDVETYLLAFEHVAR